MFDGLIKYDLAKGTSEHHVYGEGRTGGEGVFVPCPDSTGEDGGWLVTYVHDAANGTSELVVVEYRDGIDAIDEHGCVDVPEGAGLGVEYDWDFIMAHRTEKAVGHTPG